MQRGEEEIVLKGGGWASPMGKELWRCCLGCGEELQPRIHRTAASPATRKSLQRIRTARETTYP